MSGFEDQMFQDDSMEVKLSCAHNHPEQRLGDVCKLCGKELPHEEVNVDGRQTPETG